MIISEQWLRDWIQLDLSAQEIADVLTNAGLEVDAVTPMAGKIDHLIVGKVLEVVKHPNADRLNLCKVDVGETVLEIVCGASNVRPDLRVAVAMVGAKLPNGLKIKRAKVRGIESNGMLCSASELGLEEESVGLIELDQDAELGQRVDDYLQLDDNLIDIDLTPNRGDCLSVQGIARELVVLADAAYHPLDIQPVAAQTDESIVVEVEDEKACPIYLGRVISGIDAQAVTPIWMQERLRRGGVRPIHPVVDITNYVMLELGQPMHAFDRSKLHDMIVVRPSKQGEKIVLLDEAEAELDGDTLVIADAQSPIAIAGVMGGLHSAIDTHSTDIVLEAAHFTRKSAAGKARRYGLHTESSHRFERGVDPQLPALAMQRATELILEICGGTAGQVATQSNAPVLADKPSVEIRLDRLKSMLGMPLHRQEVADILNRISEKVVDAENTWQVTPPSYRFDIELEADLVEEVARVKGYDSIPTSMPRIAPRSVTGSEAQVGLRQFRQTLVARDYREVITYSFISADSQAMFSAEQPVAVANPLADNLAVMRTSLLPGLIDALRFNANRQHARIRLFESGASYHKSDTGYSEVQRLAGVVTGSAVAPQWGVKPDRKVDFYDLKADLEAVLSLTGQKNPIIFNEFEHIALHPGQGCTLSRCIENDNDKHDDVDEQSVIDIGYMGRLHPALEKELGLNQVFVFELNLEQASLALLPAYQTVSKFPGVKRDVSLVVEESIPVNALVELTNATLGTSLAKIDVFDVYRGEGVGSNQKSVSLSLLLRHVDKTMTDEDAEVLIQACLQAWKEQLNAVLRS